MSGFLVRGTAVAVRLQLSDHSPDDYRGASDAEESRQVGDRARVGFLVLFFAEDRRAFAYRFGGEYGFEAAAYAGFVKPFAQHVGQRAVVGTGDVLDFEPRGVGFGSLWDRSPR